VPAVRLSIRPILELLRLDTEQHRSVRQIAASLGVARSTVADYHRRFRESGLPWPLPADLDEVALEARLFPSGPARQPVRPLPDWATVHAEHKQPGVTRQLLWLEYKAAHPDGYQYTQFCAHYARWRATVDPVLRQEYRAGERVFQEQIFVGALGASHYLYVEAT